MLSDTTNLKKKVHSFPPVLIKYVKKVLELLCRIFGEHTMSNNSVLTLPIKTNKLAYLTYT
jgi:hypothetical protein